MSRIRTVKPEFFKNWRLFQAEKDSGLPLRLAFESLWTVCDREGRFEWIPEQLKIECLPYDEIDFSRVLHALTTRGYVVKYEVKDREYGHIPTFLQHQVINNRERPSTLPEPNENNILTREARDDDASCTREVHALGERKGKEGKGITEAKASDSPAVNKQDEKKNLWRDGVAMLTKSGIQERAARALLGKLVKEVGDTEAAQIIKMADDKADPVSYLAACTSKIFLPIDNQELWDFRSKIGMDPFFDDVKSCHEEILSTLREHPELRVQVQHLIDNAKHRALSPH